MRGVSEPLEPIPFGDAPDDRSDGSCERCDAGVLVVQLCGGDALAEGRTPQEVAAIVEAFYRTAGEEADGHGGYAERGELCAVQCVFGDPAAGMRAADVTLASGRDMRDRLAVQLPGVRFSIGISVGAGVFGWIGARRRFEPLAICAPVSEARRLCKVAWRAGPSVLASERALARASSSEAGRWSPAGPAGCSVAL